MSVIIGMNIGTVMYMTGDTGAWTGWNRYTKSKVWREGELLIGVSGSMRLLDVLRYGVVIPQPDFDGCDLNDMQAYIVRHFIPVARAAAFEAHQLKVENEHDNNDSSILVGIRGKFFTIDEDWGSTHTAGGGLFALPGVASYSAVGLGAEYALGSMVTLLWLRPEWFVPGNRLSNPADLLARCALAASKFSSGVSDVLETIEYDWSEHTKSADDPHEPKAVDIF